MKQKKILLRNLNISFLICLSFYFSLYSQERAIQRSPLKKPIFSSQPLHQVASVGASTTGSLVEGSVGSTHKGCRHRFYCHSNGPTAGFLGPQTIAKPVSLKDQPGVFPAPLMGAATVTFNFNYQDLNVAVTPIIVRPDGTVFQGLPMTSINSPQMLVISSPAQTGIYTLFVLAHQKNSFPHVKVDASISTQPQNSKTFHLKPFEPDTQDIELISAEFIYIPSP